MTIDNLCYNRNEIGSEIMCKTRVWVFPIFVICIFLVFEILLTISAPYQGSRGGGNPEDTRDPRPSFRQLIPGEGQVTAVTGTPESMIKFYSGFLGGGLWMTSDAGNYWENVSDDSFESGAIGAIRVSQSEPNIVYAGTGPALPDTQISQGIGVYKSTDSGRTWKHIGLEEAGQIAAIELHPKDPDIVYVAALGNMLSPHPERGVFHSIDGGKSWEKILYIDERAGVCDFDKHPVNPKILYACVWSVSLRPAVNGGEDWPDGVYRSLDGGEHWERLRKGLPSAKTGKSSIAISPTRPDRVWALINAQEHQSGLYRSDDSGESWRLVNADPKLLSHYYGNIYAEPTDANTIFAVNRQLYVSIDAGQTFEVFAGSPQNSYNLWINPENSRVMIAGTGSGPVITFDGGSNWLKPTQGQPVTSEIYNLELGSSSFPYHIYSAQRGGRFSRTQNVQNRSEDALSVYKEVNRAYFAVEPEHPNRIYLGSYQGSITRLNFDTERFEILPFYPPAIGNATDVNRRFHRFSPLIISSHDSKVLYQGSQVIYRSVDRGFSWEVISPDLVTTPKPATVTGQIIPMGFDTEFESALGSFNTIISLRDSVFDPSTLWASTNNGLVHITRDSGHTWNNITPDPLSEIPAEVVIETSRHRDGRVHIAARRNRRDDFRPYIYQTNDFGRQWKLITDRNGIPEYEFVHVIREDLEVEGLLYAGTSTGIYLSFDDGGHWQPLKLNLPKTPVTDIALHPQRDLVLATNGRGIWVFDDLTLFQELAKDVELQNLKAYLLPKTAAQLNIQQSHLFSPRPVYLGYPETASFDLFLGAKLESKVDGREEQSFSIENVRLDILDRDGNLVARFLPSSAERQPNDIVFEASQGFNRLNWNLRHRMSFDPPTGLTWDEPMRGPLSLPGVYEARLTVKWTQQEAEVENSRPLAVLPDPQRPPISAEERQNQYQLAQELAGELNELWATLGRVELLVDQLELLQKRPDLRKMEELNRRVVALKEELSLIKERITRIDAGGNLILKGGLDYQVFLLYSVLVSEGGRVTESIYERHRELQASIQRIFERFHETVDIEVARLSSDLVQAGIGPISGAQ